MPYFEEDDFYDLIGDQLVTLGRKKHDLLHERPIELTIDGHKKEFPRIKSACDASGNEIAARWHTVFDAVQDLYGHDNPIPFLCHQDHMTPAGVCRVCLVNIKTGRGAKLGPACRRRIEPGMVIETIRSNPDAILPTVKMVVELLLSDYHPARGDNLQIGEKGENELLRIADMLGISRSTCRLPLGEPTRPRDNSSLLIKVDHNACILCDRCIRGCNEIRGNNIIGRMGKGYSARIAFDLDDPMGGSKCVTCGECMVSCPTGALSTPAIVPGKLPPGGEVPDPKTLPGVVEVDLPAKPDEAAPQAKDEREPDAPTSPGAAPQEKKKLVPIFKGISEPFLSWNRKAIVRRRFCAGEVICREGDYGSSAFIMEKGRFEVRINSSLGRAAASRAGGLFGIFRHLVNRSGGRNRDAEQRQFTPIDAPVALKRDEKVAILEPSDVLFGEMTCMSQYPRSATVTALEDCVVLEIQRNVLYMLQRNKVSSKILEGVYRRRTLDTHLRTVKTFTDLISSAEDFNKFVDFLRDKVQLVRVHPGQVILSQGDVADYFYMVRSGFVKVEEKWQGVTRGINYLGPGAISAKSACSGV